MVLDLGERVKGDSRQPEGQRREERASSWIKKKKSQGGRQEETDLEETEAPVKELETRR